ncbi:MAG: ATP-binding protein, partial [Pseudomonadota bacterium]
FPRMIDIQLDLAEELSAIKADPVQIDQIVMNLSINAKEAMPDGGRLKITTRDVYLDEEYCKSNFGVKPGKYVSLSVSDTGRGMDKQTLSRIFEPFFSTKEKGTKRGTGLGLSVVSGIVDKHGGRIVCESELGKGTRFQILFPAIEFREQPLESSEPLLRPTGTETILLVEDEPLIANFAERILSNSGYTVITSANGHEAIKIYSERGNEISLVIMDLIMPEMFGDECLKELIRIDPLVKVIISSGFSPDDHLKKEIQGAKGFVNKPYKVSTLLNTIYSVLERH